MDPQGLRPVATALTPLRGVGQRPRKGWVCVCISVNQQPGADAPG